MLTINTKFKLKEELKTNTANGRQIKIFYLDSPNLDSLTFRCQVDIIGETLPQKGCYIIIKNAIPDNFITGSGSRNLTVSGPVTIEVEVEPSDEEKARREQEWETSQIEEKRANQEEIKSWIDDSFSLKIDGSRIATKGDGSKSIRLNNTENPNVVFQAIKEYIKNNSRRFRLSDNFVTLPFDRHGLRPWWCPQVPEGDPRNIYQKTASAENQGMVVSGIRVIQLKDNSNFSLHPAAFLEQGYEELKELIPNACQVKGCYSNHCNNYLTENLSEEEMVGQKYNSDYNYAVTNSMCGYHSMLQNGEPSSTAELSPEDIVHNQKVTEYLNRVQPTMKKFTELLAQVSSGNESKFYEIDNGISLVNQILNKCNEDERGFCAKSSLMLPLEIEIRDSTQEKSVKRAYFTNKINELNDIIVKKQKEAMLLIEELLRKQDEHINNNQQESDSNNQNLPALRQRFIQIIQNALNSQSPQVANNELESVNRDWEQQINKESNKQAEIKNIYDRVLTDISNKRAAKFEADRLRKIIQEAKNLQNYEELSQKLQQIESFRGQKEYNALKSEIDALENRLVELARDNSEKYQQDSINAINENLKQKNVEENELSTEVKDNLDKVRNREITDPTQIKEIKEQTYQEINQKEAENKLNQLLKEYEAAVTSQAKEAVKKKIMSFIFSNNSSCQKAYQNQKSQVDAIIGIKDETQKQQKTDKFPFYSVMIIGSVLVVAVVLLIIIRNYRLRRKRSL